MKQPTKRFLLELAKALFAAEHRNVAEHMMAGALWAMYPDWFEKVYTGNKPIVGRAPLTRSHEMSLRIKVGFAEQRLPKPADRIKNMAKMEYLRRRDDGTVYARRCTECGAASKIYQNTTHKAGCSALREGCCSICEGHNVDCHICGTPKR